MLSKTMLLSDVCSTGVENTKQKNTLYPMALALLLDSDATIINMYTKSDTLNLLIKGGFNYIYVSFPFLANFIETLFFYS